MARQTFEQGQSGLVYDHLVPARHAQRTYDEARSEKQLILYQPGQPGSIHCSYDGFPYTIPALFDWLADRLAVRARTSKDASSPSLTY